MQGRQDPVICTIIFNKLKENGLQVMTSLFEKMLDQSLAGKAIEGNA